MDNHDVPNSERSASFGRRRVTPHVCLLTSKRHIRSFLAETFAELGFVTHECDDDAALAAAHQVIPPDLVVIALSPDAADASMTLHMMAATGFGGMVMLMGGRGSSALESVQSVGEHLGLTMLPALGTPFRTEDLEGRVAALRPSNPPPQAPVDIEEALSNGWLELWYQPKIDPRSLLSRGAEALIRLRHPIWGTVLPAYFIPADGDPHFRKLSEFVVARVIEDWLYFAEHWIPVEIAINLPMTLLKDPEFIELLYRQIPRHPAFNGLIVEIDGAEIIRDLPLAQAIATKLRDYNVGISIDDVGAEWTSLTALRDFPFVEIKVDRQFVQNCGEDRLKRSMCSTIIDVARRFGVRTVAEGVETRADLLAVRELGFDLVQGFLFAKAMEPRKFARTLHKRRVDVLR